MVETGFHFAQPIWLWGLLLVPLVIAWLLYSSPFRQHGQEAKYADPELMPYLSGMATTRSVRSRRPLLAWVVAWSLLSMAMAGPRWDFRQMNPFDPGADLVILLDISRSMDVADVNPSRLDRARHHRCLRKRVLCGLRRGFFRCCSFAFKRLVALLAENVLRRRSTHDALVHIDSGPMILTRGAAREKERVDRRRGVTYHSR